MLRYRATHCFHIRMGSWVKKVNLEHIIVMVDARLGLKQNDEDWLVKTVHVFAVFLVRVYYYG